MTQLSRDGVACWNTKKPLNSETLGLVAQDSDKLIFTNDLKVGDWSFEPDRNSPVLFQVDQERNLWVLSDRMPTFIYKQLDPTQINYRIFKVKVDDAIVGTPCAV